MTSVGFDIVEQFDTYEDYLDSQLTALDLEYLGDEETARQLVELGYRGVGDTIRREVPYSAAVAEIVLPNRYAGLRGAEGTASGAKQPEALCAEAPGLCSLRPEALPVPAGACEPGGASAKREAHDHHIHQALQREETGNLRLYRLRAAIAY